MAALRAANRQLFYYRLRSLAAAAAKTIAFEPSTDMVCTEGYPESVGFYKSLDTAQFLQGKSRRYVLTGDGGGKASGGIKGAYMLGMLGRQVGKNIQVFQGRQNKAVVGFFHQQFISVKKKPVSMFGDGFLVVVHLIHNKAHLLLLNFSYLIIIT